MPSVGQRGIGTAYRIIILISLYCRLLFLITIKGDNLTFIDSGIKNNIVVYIKVHDATPFTFSEHKDNDAITYFAKQVRFNTLVILQN